MARTAQQFFVEVTKTVVEAINTDGSLKEMQKRAQDLANRLSRVNGDCQARAEAVAKDTWEIELKRWKAEP